MSDNEILFLNSHSVSKRKSVQEKRRSLIDKEVDLIRTQWRDEFLSLDQLPLLISNKRLDCDRKSVFDPK